MRFMMDIVLVFPSLLLAIVIVAMLGPGLFNAMIAVAVVMLPGYTRLVAGRPRCRNWRATTSPPRAAPAPARCG